MNPMTPSGTRTREISIPLGRRHDSTTVPTGSGSAAISRSPCAISSMRASVSIRRSRKARATRPRARPTDLAELGRVEVHDPARELPPPGAPQQGHHLARGEVALDLDDTRGQEALPPLS